MGIEFGFDMKQAIEAGAVITVDVESYDESFTFNEEPDIVHYLEYWFSIDGEHSVPCSIFQDAEEKPSFSIRPCKQYDLICAWLHNNNIKFVKF